MCLKKYSFYEHLTKHHHTIGGWQGLAVVFRGRIWLTRHPLQNLTTYLTRLHLHELRISKVTKSISKSTKINRIKSSYHPHLQGGKGWYIQWWALWNSLRKALFCSCRNVYRYVVKI